MKLGAFGGLLVFGSAEARYRRGKTKIGVITNAMSLFDGACAPFVRLEDAPIRF